MRSLRGPLEKFLKEPPLRLLMKAIYGVLPVSVRTRALWDISGRPNYLNGLVLAADQARQQGLREFAAIEFGVAGGNGLLTLQQEALAVEQEFGVSIKVIGFDNGPAGLPAFNGDYRDHPDSWQPGDYPMDEAKLRARLSDRTTLILGNVRDTIPQYLSSGEVVPVGFISMDVDLYSSTMDALKVLTLPGSRRLHRTFIYMDDVELIFCHKFAGELLAIDDFNRENASIKIDRLRGFAGNRPFPDREYINMMYVAHDLDAISRVKAPPTRTPLMTHSLGT